MIMNYTVEWTALQDDELSAIIENTHPLLIDKLKELTKPNSLPTFEILEEFESDTICRPRGSNRAFYIKSDNSEAVLAVKGTEVISSQLIKVMKIDKNKRLENRPWSNFENFVYREQKAPMAMLFNEALSETVIAAKFQNDTFKNFGIVEEAPLPLLAFKWNDETVREYMNNISSFLDQRAKELIFPLIDRYGLGGIIYHYPYLPTRIRFERTHGKILSKNLTSTEKLTALKKLIDIQARMFLSGYVPFSFEDHGIGQCIAPQNVTVRGGICDVGSIKFSKSVPKKDLFTILRATGGILTRTVFELLGTDVSDAIYEFENPTTLQHHLSAVVHDRLKKSIFDHSIKNSIEINPLIKAYYSSDDEALKMSLGLN